MTISTDFSLVEKLAIVRAVDEVILADGTIHSKEITALCQLLQLLDFDSNFILQARNITPEQAQVVMNGMSLDKKEALANILEEMAISDGFVHEKESILMADIFASIGIG